MEDLEAQKEEDNDVEDYIEENYTDEDDDELDFDDDFSMDFNKAAKRVFNDEMRKELKKWKPIEKDFSLEYHLIDLQRWVDKYS